MPSNSSAHCIIEIIDLDINAKLSRNRLMWKRRIYDDLERDQIAGDQRGFVLISVIWISGLIAVLATAFAIVVRSNTLASSNNLYNTKAEALADGMARFAIISLMTQDSATNLNAAANRAYNCSMGSTANFSVTIQDQGGLVDINTASPVLLEKLFTSFAADPSKSQSLTDALTKFKSPIEQTNLDILETYPSKNFGPKHQALLSLDELDQVPGFDQGFISTLKPFITVYSQQTGIDPTRAPAELKTILGDPIAIEFTSPSPRKIFSIDVVAGLANGARFHREAVIGLLGQPDKPFAIMSWRPKYDPTGKKISQDSEPCPIQ